MARIVQGGLSLTNTNTNTNGYRVLALTVTCMLCEILLIRGFHVHHSHIHINTRSVTLQAKGFGSSGSGFGDSTSSSKKKGKKQKNAPSVAKAADSFQSAAKSNPKEAKRILKLYNGDVQKGTMERISKARADLPFTDPALAEAMTLYEDETRWQISIRDLDVLAEASIPPNLFEASKRRVARLEELQKMGIVTQRDVHNGFQRVIWDASADARGFRSGAELSGDMQTRLDDALGYAAAPVLAAGLDGRILDVGCGTGSLVPELERAGIGRGQIVGVDISNDMVRVAQEKYGGRVRFVASDFLEFGVDPSSSSDEINIPTFDTVMFCMSLHDLPDPTEALNKAATLVKPNGRIVIAHPRGASHVLMQRRKNILMVPNALPTLEELKDMLTHTGTLLQRFRIVVEPGNPGDAIDEKHGYLAVLEATE